MCFYIMPLWFRFRKIALVGNKHSVTFGRALRPQSEFLIASMASSRIQYTLDGPALKAESSIQRGARYKAIICERESCAHYAGCAQALMCEPGRDGTRIKCNVFARHSSGAPESTARRTLIYCGSVGIRMPTRPNVRNGFSAGQTFYVQTVSARDLLLCCYSVYMKLNVHLLKNLLGCNECQVCVYQPVHW